MDKMKKRKFRAVFLLLTICCALLSGCMGNRTAQKAENFYPVAELPLSPVFQKPAEPQPSQGKYQPLNYEQMKGVWVSYLEYHSLFQGKGEEDFKAAAAVLLDDVKKRGLNTVIFQVRSHGDAYYPSQYYPWSRYVTGTYGKDPGYDPLKLFLDLAHERELSVHAWLNPYRLASGEQLASLPEENLLRQWYQKEEYMREKDGYWYLNPGNQEARKLIADGAAELVERYPIDGLQIDDYFYVIPPETYGHTEEEARGYTTSMVQGLYTAVKEKNEKVLFGVSPAGNYLEIPRSDTTQYTDLTVWCTKEGYLDYVMPQIYWALDDEAAPFETVLKKWEALVQKGNVKLYAGLASYKFEGTKVMEDQLQCLEASGTAKGYALFRYGNLK
jgi:uncharacterized lipoprotein YddW (UPF0748 family)